MQSEEFSVRRLLLVEDSISFSYCIKSKIENEVGIEIILAGTLEEARRAIEKYNGEFFLALLDLNLPDASGDTVAALASEHKIPSIAFTGTCSDEMRDRLFDLGVIDYLIKDNSHSLNQVVSTVRRLFRNTEWHALVVDDSALQRAHISSLLKKYKFRVLEAEDGPRALEILERIPDVRLVITDFNMPKMDGCELAKAIRQKFAPERLAIIGISGESSSPLTAKFLKHGANDFLIKPFVREEFFCRVTQNMDYLDNIQALSEAATRDHLTGLANRVHFLDVADAFLSQAEFDRAECTIGVVDIDLFSTLNETHGHLIGDEILAHVGNLIRSSVSRNGDVVARYGGEEFAVFLYDADVDSAELEFERIRQVIEQTPYMKRGEPVPLTVSIGHCSGLGLGVTDMVGAAEYALAQAKAGGRNLRVAAENGGLDYFNDREARKSVGVG